MKVAFNQDDDLDLVSEIIGVFRRSKQKTGSQSTLPGNEDESERSVLCERCGKDIFKISTTPEKTLAYSNKYHGGNYCYRCQQILRKEKEALQ